MRVPFYDGYSGAQAFEKPSAMLRDDPAIPTSQWFSEGT
jgi:hypothetical protein